MQQPRQSKLMKQRPSVDQPASPMNSYHRHRLSPSMDKQYIPKLQIGFKRGCVSIRHSCSIATTSVLPTGCDSGEAFATAGGTSATC